MAKELVYSQMVFSYLSRLGKLLRVLHHDAHFWLRGSLLPQLLSVLLMPFAARLQPFCFAVGVRWGGGNASMILGAALCTLRLCCCG